MTQPDADILRFFDNEHLPPDLRKIAEAIRGVALWVAATVPANAERRAGFRRLLESKDCFVRAQLTGAAEAVLVTRAEYAQLLAASRWLGCLEAAGVDNWEGCAHAAELRREIEEGQRGQ